MRGWIITPSRGWTVEDGLLRLERGPTTVRVLTDRGYRNLTMALQARTDDAQAVFGLLVRATLDQRGIKLEIYQGQPRLVIGNRIEPVDFVWTPGAWHAIRVLAMQQDLEVSIDGRKVASITGVSIGGPGAIGMYCSTGTASFRDLRIQRFAD